MTTPPRSPRNSLLVLAGLWGLLLLLAALRPLAVPDEGRYAEVGRWMLQSGDWLVPRLNGIPFFHKPPLLHWLLAGAMGLFGVSAWVARLVPALNAGLMLLALYLSARRLAGEAVARRSAIMLGTSLAFLVGGQYINHDMLVAAWISIAIWLFALAYMEAGRPNPGLARLGFAACALGVLAKGLIGLVLPGLVLLAWLVWTRQFKRMLQLPWASGLALFAVVAVPWFALAQHSYPGLFDYLFGVQQFQRYTGTNFNNARPWWFYDLALWGMMFPWVFWALAATGPARRAAPALDSRVLSLCWCWVIAIVAFFSIPASKLVGYVLPVMPPLALLASLGWQRATAGWRWERQLFTGLAILAAGAALAIHLFAERTERHKLAADIATTLRCEMRPGDTVYAVGGYPYDLPFIARLDTAMVVVQDWPALRRSAGDGWERELFEGADFDPRAGKVLQTPDVLDAAARVAGHWLVAPVGYSDSRLSEWTEVQRGSGWALYRSKPSTGQPTLRCRPAP